MVHGQECPKCYSDDVAIIAGPEPENNVYTYEIECQCCCALWEASKEDVESAAIEATL